MTVNGFKISTASMALLAVQLALVCSIAVKYVSQRRTCPRVWTRAAGIEPSLPMRGRYLSLLLTVDGCQSTLPSAKQAQFPRKVDGTPTSDKFAIFGPGSLQFPAKLTVENNRLAAIRIPNPDNAQPGELVLAAPGAPCDQMHLLAPVDFYLPEHAVDPSLLKPGQELWIEVSLPPRGAPRPIQLAMKENGVWRPLAFN